MKTLTARQQAVLDFIAAYLEEHAYPPTIREIADRFAISVKGAYDHVKALEKKGKIRLGENRSRALEIIRDNRHERSVVEIPLLGVVAAGKPIFAEENFPGEFRYLPTWLSRPPALPSRSEATACAMPEFIMAT